MTLPVAAAHLAGFARLLRSTGFGNVPEQTVTFLDAVRLLGPRSMTDIREAALATLAPQPDRHREFEALFRAWFWGDPVAAADGKDDEETQVKEDGGGREELPVPEESFPAGEMASSTETLAARQFPHEDTDLTRLRRCLPAAIPKRRSFRNVRASRGRPDLRRSLRLIVRSDGDIFDPILRRRPQVQRKLLVLIDISGSMKLHTAGHLRLAHAIVRNADRAEVFTLGTRLTRITAPLRIADCGRALARVAETVEDWDGGTRIGPTLLALLSVPRFAAFARGAAVVILSDGLEREGHAEMEQAFRRLKARAFRLSLLTPLAADGRFRPRTAALAAVLPYLDDLADGSGIGPVADFILSLARPAKRARDIWREVS
ncbi:MAG TPA: VWA domain-containing protein [Mesorhizobium sp.]